MNADEVIAQIKKLGKASYKKTMLNHGVKEPIYGASIADMKKIVKGVKKDQKLALDLYASGIYDAMYLAGLVADDEKFTKKDLETWVEKANCAPLADYTVAWVAAGSPYGRELALAWIDSKRELTACAGWSTLSGIVAITDDADLDLAELRQLIDRVAKTIHQQPNRVRYSMNGFVLAAGGFVKALTADAVAAAKKMGTVEVDMGDTSCQVPSIVDYLAKMKARGVIGKKKKTVKC